jgi:TonB family protein
MIRFLFILFLSVNFVFGQTVYQAHEVSKTAEPQGGNKYLLQFIENNVQVPFQARLKNITGRVFVSGIVEPEGHLSDLKVARSLHPLCDKEALRLMRLYKAWTPAQKDGKAVRQLVTLPVLIPEMPVLNYDSTSHGNVQYFDKNFKPTTDPALYAHKFIVPLDEKGFLASDIILKDLKTKKSTVIGFYESKKEVRHFYDSGVKIDSAQVVTVSGLGTDNIHYAPIVTQKIDGTVICFRLMNTYFETNIALNYFSNGLLQHKYERVDDVITETSWYQNGQIKQVKETLKKKPMTTDTTYIVDFWTKTGKHLVNNGNGWLSQNTSQSGENENGWQLTYSEEVCIEQGQIKQGLKTGKWTGKWADSTLFYEERYENGEIKEAFAVYDGQKVAYTEVQKQPEFKGGVGALLQFLGSNITYPREALRKNISGKVYLTFVIDKQGKVGDVEVVKGIGGGCDEEAIRVVKKMTGLWKPGLYRGKLVNVKYNLPISFVLE